MSDKPATAAQAKRVAEDALASGLADGLFARPHGRFLDPLRVSAPDGDLAGWMIPLASGGLLLGFVQVTPAGEFYRYASFHRPPGADETCPLVASWTNPTAILDRASAVAGPSDRLSDPVLTYDRSPDRLAWAVTATSPDGTQTTIYVAGDAAWVR